MPSIGIPTVLLAHPLLPPPSPTAILLPNCRHLQHSLYSSQQALEGMLSNILSQPKQQNAEATIITLCDRLSHSTEIADRRAAALALKGFSHNYRELIASSGLQGLIDALKTDSHDQELRRACLETLIVLFIKTGNTDLVETARKARERNKTYLSPLIRKQAALNGASSDSNGVCGDEISLLLTDRFTQLPENIELLLLFVDEQPDVFTTLYALQLISAIVLNRPDRARECLMMAPNGISLLVRTLESPQEMIRNEGILLLLHLTENDIDSQKLVAFEGTFDSVLNILNEEGGLAYGTQQIIEDCLGLLGNLIEYNVSNQKLFCESNLVNKFADLFDVEVPENEAAVTNIVSALQLPRLFCIPGAQATAANQLAFGKNFLLKTLRLAFGPASPLSIRTAALITCSSLIWTNKDLQQQFMEIDVPYYDLSVSLNILRDPTIVPVADALLKWMCALNTAQTFDLRGACLLCLEAVFKENHTLQQQFIEDQVRQYKADTPCNLVSVLAEYNESVTINPFQVWFCCGLLINLFEESHDIKDLVREIKVGDPDLGQEVSPIIQSIGSQLLASLSYREPFVALGYLQLLSVWLFDDVPAVNEFLAESAVIQGLVSYVVANREVKPNVLVQSLATILLGIAYDFSSKDSPLSRSSFHHLLVSTLGKDQFIHQVRRFRESHHYREYRGVMGATKGENGLPQVFIERGFYDFISENIARVAKSINKAPDFEPTSRVSLEMFEDLKLEIKTKQDEFQATTKEQLETIAKLEATKSELSTKLDGLEAEHAKLVASQTALESKHQQVSAEFKSTSAQLEKTAAQLTELKKTHETTLAELETLRKSQETSKQQQKALQTKFDKLSEAKTRAETGINKMTRELMTLTKAKEALDKELAKLKSEHDKVVSSEKDLQSAKSAIDAQLTELTATNTQLKATNDKLVAKLRETAEVLKSKEEDEALFEQAIEDVEKYQQELKAANTRIANFERESKLMKGKLETAKKDAKKAAERQEELEQQLADRLKQLESAQGSVDELAALKADVEVMQPELETAKKLASTLEGQLKTEKTAFEEKAKAMKAQIKDLEQQISAKSKDLEHHKEKAAVVETLTHDKDNAEKELANVKKQLIDLKNQLSAKEQEGTNLRDQHEKAIKELQDKHNKAMAELDEHKNASNDLRAQHEQAKSELEEHKKAVADLKDQHDKATAELKKKHQKEISESKDQHAKVKFDLDNATKELGTAKESHAKELDRAKEFHAKEFQSAKQEHFKELESLKEGHIKELEGVKGAHTKGLESAKEAHTKELNASKDIHAKKLASVTESLSSLEDSLSTTKESLSAANKKAKDAAEESKQKQAKIVALQSDIKNAQSELEKLKDAHADKISTLEAEIDATKSSSKGASEKLISSFKEKITAKDTKINELEAQVKAIDEKSARVEALEKELAELRSEYKQLESDKAGADNEVKTQKAALKASETKEADASSRVKALEAQLAESSKSTDSSAKKLAQLEQKFAANESESQSLKNELEKLKEAETSAKSSKSELETQLKEAQKQATSLTSKVDELETKLKEAHVASSEAVDDLEKKLKDAESAAQKSGSESTIKLRKAEEKLKEAQSTNSAAIDSLKKELKDAESAAEKAAQASLSKISELEKQVADSQQASAAKESAKLEDLEKQLKEAETKSTAAQAQVAKLEAQLQSTETRLSQAEKKSSNESESQAKIAELENQVSESQAKTSDLEKQLAKAQKDSGSSASASQKQVTDLENQLKAANSKSAQFLAKVQAADKLESQVDALTAKVHEYQTQLKEAQTKAEGSDKLKADLDEKSTALDELMELLDDLTEGKARYKSKVKELGHDVSDSEDEEE